MSNVFKFFTIRVPDVKTKEEISTIGDETHPSNVENSKWFEEIKKISKTNNIQKIQEYARKYVNSKEAIHTIDDLTIPDVLPRWLSEHRPNDIMKDEKNKSYFLNLSEVYQKNKDLAKKLKKDLARTADTMLAYSLLKELGQSSLDYVLLFRSLKIVEYISYTKEKKYLLHGMERFLHRHIFLPNFRCPSSDTDESMYPPMYQEKILSSSRECCKEEKPVKPHRKCVCTLSYIADLMVLRDELVGYEGADLAYIETVMLGEKLTREHRRLEQTETYSENETTSSRSQENDHQVNDRFSLQTEAEKTIESDLSVDAGVTAKAWGTGYSVEATTNGSYNSSKSESKRVAKEKAIDITERSVLKIQKTVRELTTKRKLIEVEETNQHELSNLTGDGGVKHINGMYQFVNARYKNQVINYGKRLMLDLVLPRPMEIYKHMMSEQSSAHSFIEPMKPNFGVWEITDDYRNTPNAYYLDLAKTYNIADLPEPPEKEKRLSFNIVNDIDVTGLSEDDRAGSQEITLGTVPSGFTAKSIGLTIKGNQDDGGIIGPNYTVLHVEGGMLSSGTISVIFTEEEKIKGTLRYVATRAVSGAGYVLCYRNESAFNAWKLEVYAKIMNKYESDLQSYNAKVASWEAAQAQKTKFGKSTFENRMIEEEQLKRQAISYISCQFYEQFIGMRDKVSPCDRPEMDLVRAKQEGKYIAFFEQAFDWSLIMYIFYPDFWAGWCHEQESKSISTSDALFDKALVASAARVQIPVKQGKESLVQHYLERGEIWFGNNEMPIPNDDYYISVAEEIKELSNFNEDREGKFSVVNGQITVTLNFTESDNDYWGYLESVAIPNTNPTEYESVYVSAQDSGAINNDMDREIMIEGITYRIVEITEDSTDTTHKTWILTLDREYEGIDATHVMWSTGGIYVGGPFFTTIPQSLVYLRNMKDTQGNYVTSDCLPSYPQGECE